MKQRKEVDIEELLKFYKLYNKRKLEKTELEKDSSDKWKALEFLDKKIKKVDEQYNKDLESLKILVQGGYPRIMYDALTPFYQIISYVFLGFGIILLLFALSNIEYSLFYIPSLISIFSGMMIILVLKKLKNYK